MAPAPPPFVDLHLHAEGVSDADLTTLADALDERGRPVAHLVRMIEYDVPDRDGNGTGELIALLTN